MSRVRFRRDLAANWTNVNPVLAVGEPGYERDTGKFKIGDGSTPWNSLPYAGGSSGGDHPDSDHADAFADKGALSRALERQNAHAMGGGVLTWDGSTLTGTSRYIWIPSGAGSSSHFVLTDAGSGGGAFTITGIGAWNIVYARLTDAQWSATTRIELTPADFIKQAYTTYQPHENDLVLGTMIGDGENRFYLADGRILDSWKALPLVNGWANYGGGYYTCDYYRDANGFVHLRGLLQGSGATANLAFTMPVGYRPASRTIFGPMASGGPYRLDVESNGNVNLAHRSWISLEGVAFQAES